MFPVERKTGRCAMVKLCGVKPHNLKVLAVMIAVAPGARFVGHMSVDSTRGVHGGLDFFMAFEALLVRQSLPVRMARRAIADPFQLVMRAGEFPGGELCLCSERNESGKYQEHPARGHSAAPQAARENRGDVGCTTADAFPVGIDSHPRNQGVQRFLLQGESDELMTDRANFVEVGAGRMPLQRVRSELSVHLHL